MVGGLSIAAGPTGAASLAGGVIDPAAALLVVAAVLIVLLPVPRPVLRRGLQAVAWAAGVGVVLAGGWRLVDGLAAILGLSVLVVVVDRFGAVLGAARREHAEERDRVERHLGLLSAVEDLPDERDPAIEAVLRTLRSLAFDHAGVALVRDDHIVTARLDGMEDLPPIPRGQGLAWRAVEEDRTVISADYGNDPDRLYERSEVVTVVVVPIRVDGRPVGVVMGSRTRAAAPSDAEVEVAEVLAAHLGGVLSELERARRQEELLERATRLDELRTGLIAAVSRDARQPIAVVAAAAEHLEVAAGDSLAGTEADLSALRGSADQLQTMILTVLDVARRRLDAETGRFEAVTVGELLALLGGGSGPHAASFPSELLEQRVWVVPSLLVHAVELLAGPSGGGRVASVAGAGGQVVLGLDPSGRRDTSPIVRSLAEQLLVAGGAVLDPGPQLQVRLGPEPGERLG